MKVIAPTADANMLLGFETSDDAAIYQLTDEIAAVLTVDFFTPVVDDPYEFGRIAAANALSDIFAMGATPRVALNLLALSCTLGTDVAAEILRGGADAVHEAGAAIAGGHTIDDDEPKYGLSVFGVVHPKKIVRNEGACPGDVLYLTKPLGMGIKNSSFNIDQETPESMRPVIDAMMELNAKAAQAMLKANVHAASDVTGFGLAGHLHEMLDASGCAAEVSIEALPLFDGVWELSAQYCRPGRSFNVMDYVKGHVMQGELTPDVFDTAMGVLCDPQTSGGLLVAIDPHETQVFEATFEQLAERRAARIGTVIEGAAGAIHLLP